MAQILAEQSVEVSLADEAEPAAGLQGIANDVLSYSQAHHEHIIARAASGAMSPAGNA